MEFPRRPVSGLVALVFIFVFREPLSTLIGRTSAVKFPGVEWSVSQVERAAAAEAAPTNSLPVTGGSDVPVAPAGLTLTPEDQDRLTDFIKAERARAALWEYRFLNFFLVTRTQKVLDWFASIKDKPTLQFYDDF